MAIQSRLPTFLLTRPAAQSQRFAAQLRLRFGPDIAIMISPLLAPVFLDPAIPNGSFAALIFTSETGVQAFQTHTARPIDLPKRAYCVGNRTAKAARSAGLEPISADGDAIALIKLIRQQAPSGTLLHVCGNHTRGDAANTLTNAGIPTHTWTLYQQAEQPLTKPSIALLQGEGPALVPLFSPRTAALFCKQALTLGALAPLTCAVLSKAVGDALSALPYATLCYAKKPTAESLQDAIADFYDVT